MTRDGGGTLAGARLAEREGEKTTLSAVTDPCEGEQGRGMVENTQDAGPSLARSTSEPPSLARSSFIPPRSPPQHCQPGSQQNKCLPSFGETDAHRKGPTQPDDMAQNQVDKNTIFPSLLSSLMIDIRGRLLTSRK